VTDGVLCEHEGTVATITLNRPEARNALTVDVKTRLLAELRRCGSDERPRAVILTGAGRAFCGLRGDQGEPGLRGHAQPGRSAEKEAHVQARSRRPAITARPSRVPAQGEADLSGPVTQRGWEAPGGWGGPGPARLREPGGQLGPGLPQASAPVGAAARSSS
jgi:hypothetical protein